MDVFVKGNYIMNANYSNRETEIKPSQEMQDFVSGSSVSRFKPAWWLPGPHLQTLWPTLSGRGKKKIHLRRERIETSDGDFIDLDWSEQQTGPIVLILHGIEGSVNSSYAKGMLQTLSKQGWRSAVMHFRSCSEEMNRLSRSYHSGETGDLAAVVNLIRTREPNTPIAAIGYSLGGNVLLKWLGETGEQNPLSAAVAVSVPFLLHNCSLKLQKGFSRFYQRYLLRILQKKMMKKFKSHPELFFNSLLNQKKSVGSSQKVQCFESESLEKRAEYSQQMKVAHMSSNNSLEVCDLQLDPTAIFRLKRLRTLRDFDHKITAPLNGFASAEDYYAKSSSRYFLKSIQVPTLLLQARDDPFMTAEAIPNREELSPSITLEASERGGHVGFVSGRVPWRPIYWLEHRIPLFLSHFLL